MVNEIMHALFLEHDKIKLQDNGTATSPLTLQFSQNRLLIQNRIAAKLLSWSC